MDDVEVVLHRGAVSVADGGGEEEEERQSRRQPAARQDALPHSLSPRQHGMDSQGTARTVGVKREREGKNTTWSAGKSIRENPEAISYGIKKKKILSRIYSDRCEHSMISLQEYY